MGRSARAWLKVYRVTITNVMRRLRSCLAASDEIRDLDEESMEFDLYTEETESSRIIICLMDKNIRVEMEE